MSINIALPPLPAWVKENITGLYSAKTEEQFDSSFDLFIAQDAKITVNGKHVSRDDYKRMILGEIKNDVSATVTFNGLVSVPTESKDLNAIGTGNVGTFFSAVVDGRLFVLGQHESSTVNSSLNVTVKKDPSLQHHQIGRGGAFDARRVFVLDEVLTDTQNHITVPPLQPPTTA